jgi:uncharacterized membrane protein
MTDYVGIAAIIAAVAAAGSQFAQNRRLRRRDDIAAKERSEDRQEAKAERASAAEKLDSIGSKVDGAQDKLLKKIDSLQMSDSALKSEVARRDVEGSVSTNEHEGPVSIDSAGTVSVEGEERRVR